MKNYLRILLILCVCAFAGNLYAQETRVTKKVPKDSVETVHVMPYVTGSLNLHSGQAFAKSASGIGFGAGFELDFTPEKSKYGFLFDFAFQDMRAHAEDGTCLTTTETSYTVRAEHYFQYALAEAFLKIQTGKSNGYLMIGPSIGYATSSFTRAVSPKSTAEDQYSYWEGTSNGNQLRLDIRGGLGIVLGQIGKHQLVVEGRFGYPILAAITDYSNVCNPSRTPGDWRIVSLQFNFGVRI